MEETQILSELNELFLERMGFTGIDNEWSHEEWPGIMSAKAALEFAKYLEAKQKQFPDTKRDWKNNVAQMLEDRKDFKNTMKRYDLLFRNYWQRFNYPNGVVLWKRPNSNKLFTTEEAMAYEPPPGIILRIKMGIKSFAKNLFGKKPAERPKLRLIVCGKE